MLTDVFSAEDVERSRTHGFSEEGERMTREKCPKCDRVFSTTGTPNEDEGYYLSDVAVERLIAEIGWHEKEISYDWFHQHPRVIRCPYCKEFSLVREGE